MAGPVNSGVRGQHANCDGAYGNDVPDIVRPFAQR